MGSEMCIRDSNVTAINSMRDEDIAAIIRVNIDAEHDLAFLQRGIWTSYERRNPCDTPSKDIVVAKSGKSKRGELLREELVPGFYTLNVSDVLEGTELEAALHEAGRTTLTRHELLGWVTWYIRDGLDEWTRS